MLTDVSILRVLALLLVLGFHFDVNFFQFGFLGVDLFFVVSGFLIWRILPISTSEALPFVWRRFQRLYPALLVTMMIFAVLILFYHPAKVISFHKQALASFFAIQNYFLFRQSGYFEPHAKSIFLLHLWSIAVEIQFYLLIAFCSCFSKILFRRTFVLVVASCSIFLMLYYGDRYANANFYFLATRLWEFCFGIVAFELRKLIGDKPGLPFLRFLKYILLLSIVIFALCLDFMDFGAFQHPGPVTIIFVLLCASYLTLPDFDFKNRVIDVSAAASYSIYLMHWSVFIFFEVTVFSSVIMSVFLGSLLYYYVDARNKSIDLMRYIFVFACMLGLVWLSAPFLVKLFYDVDRVQVLHHDFHDESIRLNSFVREKSIKAFDADRRPDLDVLIIGDSFAMDVSNALLEVLQGQEVGFVHLSSSCGVVWDAARVAHLWPKPIVKVCLGMGDIEQVNVSDYRPEAIFIASKWAEWHLPYLEETLANLSSSTDKVIIFGSKHFGGLEIESFARGDRDDLKFEVDRKLLLINAEVQRVASLFSDVYFIPTMDAFCLQLCDNFNYQLKDIISYDGFHLTSAGTLLLADFITPQVLKVLNDRP